MKRNIEGYIKWLGDRRAREKRAMALVLAMSIAVSGSVCWLMRNTGTALADDAICGIEEHKHTDDCYEKVLICEEDHEHTDECYETKLVCELPEHTHSELCYIDVTSHEKASDWEKTIPELSGNPSADLMSVASSQMGYEEGKDGYSRYGDWYGNDDGDWNVMFVSFCLNYAGILSSKIPYGAGCWAWQVKLEESGLLVTDKSSEPLPGDILLIDDDGDGKCDRAGIVISVDGSAVCVIEGDVDGKVDTVTYQLDDSSLYGFVSVNSLDETEDQDSVSADPAEEQTEDNIITFEDTTQSGIAVCAKAPEGAFPEGVTMAAADVDDKDVISQAEEAAGKNLGDKEEVKGTLAVDITFTDSEGNEVEPAEGMTVDVSITIPESKQLEGKDYQLFHVNDEGIKLVDDAVVSAGEVAFSTEGFSIFIITSLGEYEKDQIHEWLAGFGYPHTEDDHIANNVGFPYIINLGDKITFVGESTNPDVVLEVDYFGITNTGAISRFPIRLSDDTVNSDAAVEKDGVYRITREFEATSTGVARVRLLKGDGTYEYCYVEVRRATGDRTPQTYYFYPDSDTSLEAYNSPYHPFLIHKGDTIVLVGSDSADGFEQVKIAGNYDSFEGSTPEVIGKRYVNDGINDPGYEYSRLFTSQGITEEGGLYTETFIADRDVTGEMPPKIEGFKDKWGFYTYFKVVTSDRLDHADIEVADDGFYTESKIYNEDGHLKKKVMQYRSYVCDVNSCDMFSSSDDSTYATIYDPNGSVREGVTGYVSGDYWQTLDHEPGDTQYELTSKYKKKWQYNEEKGVYEWVIDFSTYGLKQFYYSDIDHAVFDVKLVLKPDMEVTYTYDSNTDKWIEDPGSRIQYTSSNPGVAKNVDSAIFHMDHQAVIDALNKCPNHSGLDFTIKASSALVQFEATKEFLGGRLIGDDFQFEIINGNGDVVAQATNDANGRILFDGIHFESEGEYEYSIREIPGDDPKIIYDNTTYPIKIIVERQPGENNFLIAEVKTSTYDYVFNNIVKFTLPETGGMGVIPFVAAGSAMIGGALILLMLRRRKEVDL